LNIDKKQENAVFSKRILAIAVPIMLSSLVSQLQMLIDRIFLGKLDIKCMSAVGNATSPIWTTMNVCFTLAVGSAILISQAIGANEKERAKALTASLFKFSNILAIILFFVWIFFPKQIFLLMGVDASVIDLSVDYARYSAPIFLVVGIGSAISCLLQVSEKTKIMIVYGLLRSGINVILDYALIFGNLGFPAMGVAGAALATTIAELCGDFVILLYVCLSKEIWLRPKYVDILKAKWRPYWESVKMGLPTACEEFAWNFGNLFLIVMLNKISPEAAGIYTIIFGVELIPVCLFGSLGNAVLTLSGQETGKGNPRGIGSLVRIASSWSIALGLFVLTMFFIFPQTIIGWFTTDTRIITSSALYLIIVGFDLFPKSLNILVGSGVKGHGDTKWVFGTQIFGTFYIISMSALLVLGLHQGIAALFILVVSDETIRCLINSWKLYRISKE